MRETELIIDEALRNGLSPLKVTPFNSQLLEQLLGFRVGKGGLEKYELKTNPLPATLGLYYDWPFPQYLTGEQYNILVFRDPIAEVDHVYSVSDDHATTNWIASVSKAVYGEGTLMEMADFGEYVFIANGAVTIYFNTVTSLWEVKQAISTIPLMRTVCNFKGQAVGGNVQSSWYDCDETYYLWSEIGSIDFTPDQDNEAGYRRCPFGGTVYHTRRLGDGVVGYSSEGIVMMVPVNDPAPTFRFVELDNVGLINQGAEDGDQNQRVYLGEDYILRRVTQKGVEELGYEYFMEQLSGEDVIISFDKKYKDFYIGNSTKTFLLTQQGLSEIPQHPSAVWRRNSGTYMIPDSNDDYYMTIVSQPFDMGYAGQKTVFEMETDLIQGDGNEVAVTYYDNPTTGSTTAYKPLNNQNVGSIIASGNALAFHLRFDPTYDDPRIGYIKARYKMTDLRGLRGVYAPPPRGQ